MQEFLSNTLKHAHANKISVSITFNDAAVALKIKDNGQGFDTQAKSESSGLINMRSRAELINAELHLFSRSLEGTELSLIYPNQ